MIIELVGRANAERIPPGWSGRASAGTPVAG